MKKYSHLNERHFQGITVVNSLAYYNNKSLYALLQPETNFVTYAVYNQMDRTDNCKPVFENSNINDAIVAYNKL